MRTQAALLASLLMAISGVASATTFTWKANTTGDWFDAANWTNEDGWPSDGDTAVITNIGSTVWLTQSTDRLAAVILGGLSAGERTLVFSNWTTQLYATNITILSNGVVTCAGPFLNEPAMSNRVWIVCVDLRVENGGKIDVDGKGYAGGGVLGTYQSGSGPGGGQQAVRIGAGSYGGRGGGTYKPGQPFSFPYGRADAPEAPGSGGGSGYTAYATRGNGGGAIRIQAEGTVTINGLITANGIGGRGDNNTGGSGGGIYIDCALLAGTGGLVRANGGGYSAGGHTSGSGGRIAVIYDPAQQLEAPLPDVTFSVAPGPACYPNSDIPLWPYDRAHCYYGDLGTLYFPDNRLLSTPLRHSGEWAVPGLTRWTVASLTISNGWIRFPEDGFELTVSNDLCIIGTEGRLELGGGVWDTNTMRGQIDRYWHWSATNGPTLTVGGNLILTNSGQLVVYSAPTHSAGVGVGALVEVAGDMVLGADCWVYPWCHPINGTYPVFRVNNLLITATNAGFNANWVGWRGGLVLQRGYGEGKGEIARSGAHGGLDGRMSSVVYGDSNAPALPGSGGGGNHYDAGPVSGNGGNGGGMIRLDVRNTFLFNGILTANGGTYGGTIFAGGGSGGAIYVTCRNYQGSSNGLMCAEGGLGPYGGSQYAGGGGGGRIAIWRKKDTSASATRTSVAGGGSNPDAGLPGHPGTVVWKFYPPEGTVILLR